MNVLETIGDEINPTIYLNHLESKFSITGESRPENPLKYYESTFKWFNEYFNYINILNDVEGSKKEVRKTLKIDLDYFNSTSAKVLFDLFVLLKKVGEEKFKVHFEIAWYYHAEDIDLLEAGKEMEAMCGLKFNYCPKN
jgi:hypothetical protein